MIRRLIASVTPPVPSPRSPDYREKIWDHAAGLLVIEEAGGRVTDMNGLPLDLAYVPLIESAFKYTSGAITAEQSRRLSELVCHDAQARRIVETHLRRFEQEGAGTAHRVEQWHARLPAGQAQDAGSEVFLERRADLGDLVAALPERFA